MADYGTAAGFLEYHTARGRELIVEDFKDDEIDAAKLVASEWLDARYRNVFPGLKVGGRAQIREWPRTGGTDRDGHSIASDVVPVEVDNATYEATLRQLNNPGSLSVDWTPNKYKAASVDGAVSVQYAMYGSAQDVQTRFAIIDEIMSPILTGCSHSSLSGGTARI